MSQYSVRSLSQVASVFCQVFISVCCYSAPGHLWSFAGQTVVSPSAVRALAVTLLAAGLASSVGIEFWASLCRLWYLWSMASLAADHCYFAGDALSDGVFTGLCTLAYGATVWHLICHYLWWSSPTALILSAGSIFFIFSFSSWLFTLYLSFLLLLVCFK